MSKENMILEFIKKVKESIKKVLIMTIQEVD